MRTKPTAVFMAFGTKGDVNPIAAIAASFASDQRQYEVAFVTHSAHEKLKVHLEAKRITYFPVSSPPVMSYQNTAGSSKVPFSLQKNEIIIKHRQECVLIAEGIFGEDTHMDGDLIIINFFALEGWSLAELFQVRCVVAAPYVVPYSDVPYNWLFPRCAAAIHHGGSGSTAAALHAGIPQVICPFILDQFYWAERMFWLGVAPEPLKSTCLLPDKDDDCYIMEAANMLVGAINRALSPEVKLQASQIANRISAEDGVSEAVRLIREEINCTGAAL